jgi:hypothetical protein
MDEVRFIAAAGGLGSTGIHAESLEIALQRKPDFIACDAGSTDGGPYYLGTGEHDYSRASIKRDIKLLLAAGKKNGIPIIVGSAGMGGNDIHVDTAVEIAQEAMSELGGTMRTAVIYAEQDKGYLKDRLAEGRIRPLDPAPHFDADTIDRSAHTVGMMGTEQIQAALEGGAQFVLAGRCSDSALYAAYPIMKGFSPGLAWHAGKVLECGTTACVSKGKGVMLGTITRDDLVITPIGKGLRCTPQSIAAHSLYENGDPYLHRECSGTLDLTNTELEAVDDVSVRVRNSSFVHADEYTVKLEGAELVGYQSLVIFGIRDPYVIEVLDTWIAEVREIVDERIRLVCPGVEKDQYNFEFRIYGRNGVMGDLEPNRNAVPHEVGIVLEITAPTQELATTFATLSRQPLLHHYVPKWSGSITGIAVLGTPGYVERGPVYRFNVNHVVLPRTPHEMFRTKFVDIG